MTDNYFESVNPKRPSIPRPSSAAAKEALKDRLIAHSNAPTRRLLPPNRKGVSYIHTSSGARLDKDVYKGRSRHEEQQQPPSLRMKKDSIVSEDEDASIVTDAPMNHSNMTRVMKKDGFQAIVNVLNADADGIIDTAKLKISEIEGNVRASTDMKHEGDLKITDASPFTYLVTDSDDPYSFRLASETPKNLTERYITLSKGGISRTQNGDSEIETLSRVRYEQQLFHALKRFKFFSMFRVLKAWTHWTTMISKRKRGAVLRKLQPHLFSQDMFIGYLVRMASGLRESILSFQPLVYQVGQTYSILYFLEEQARRREFIQDRFDEEIDSFIACFASEGEKIVMAALLDLPSVISAVNRAPRPAVIADSSFITSMASSVMMENSHVYTNYAAVAAPHGSRDIGMRERREAIQGGAYQPNGLPTYPRLPFQLGSNSIVEGGASFVTEHQSRSQAYGYNHSHGQRAEGNENGPGIERQLHEDGFTLYSGMGLSYTEKAAVRQKCRQLFSCLRMIDFSIRDSKYQCIEGAMRRQLLFMQGIVEEKPEWTPYKQRQGALHSQIGQEAGFSQDQRRFEAEDREHTAKSYRFSEPVKKSSGALTQGLFTVSLVMERSSLLKEAVKATQQRAQSKSYGEGDASATPGKGEGDILSGMDIDDSDIIPGVYEEEGLEDGGGVAPLGPTYSLCTNPTPTALLAAFQALQVDTISCFQFHATKGEEKETAETPLEEQGIARQSEDRGILDGIKKDGQDEIEGDHDEDEEERRGSLVRVGRFRGLFSPISEEVQDVSTGDFLDADSILAEAASIARGKKKAKDEARLQRMSASGADGTSIASLIGDALKLLNESLQSTYRHAEKYAQLCAIYAEHIALHEDREALKTRLYDLESSEIDDLLCRCRWHKKVTMSTPQSFVEGLIFVDLSGVIERTTAGIDATLDLLASLIPAIYVDHSRALVSEMSAHATLLKSPYETLEGYVEQVLSYRRIQESKNNISDKYSHVQSLVTLMEDRDLAHTAHSAAMTQEVGRYWRDFDDALSDFSDNYIETAKTCTVDIKARASTLATECKPIQEYVSSEAVRTLASSPAADVVDSTIDSLSGMLARMQRISREAELLMRQQALTCEGHYVFHIQSIDDLYYEISVNLTLWQLFQTLHTAYRDIFHTTVMSVPVTRLYALERQARESLHRDVHSVCKARKLPPNSAVETAVESLLRRIGSVLPTLFKLQSPYFKDKHKEACEVLFSRKFKATRATFGEDEDREEGVALTNRINVYDLAWLDLGIGDDGSCDGDDNNGSDKATEEYVVDTNNKHSVLGPLNRDQSSTEPQTLLNHGISDDMDDESVGSAGEMHTERVLDNDPDSTKQEKFVLKQDEVDTTEHLIGVSVVRSSLKAEFSSMGSEDSRQEGIPKDDLAPSSGRGKVVTVEELLDSNIGTFLQEEISTVDTIYLESVYEYHLGRHYASVAARYRALEFRLLYDSKNKLVTILNCSSLLMELNDIETELQAIEMSKYVDSLPDELYSVHESVDRALQFVESLEVSQSSYLRMRLLYTEVRTARLLHPNRKDYNEVDSLFKKLTTNLKVHPSVESAVSLESKSPGFSTTKETSDYGTSAAFASTSNGTDSPWDVLFRLKSSVEGMLSKADGTLRLIRSSAEAQAIETFNQSTVDTIVVEEGSEDLKLLTVNRNSPLESLQGLLLGGYSMRVPIPGELSVAFISGASHGHCADYITRAVASLHERISSLQSSPSSTTLPSHLSSLRSTASISLHGPRIDLRLYSALHSSMSASRVAQAPRQFYKKPLSVGDTVAAALLDIFYTPDAEQVCSLTSSAQMKGSFEGQELDSATSTAKCLHIKVVHVLVRHASDVECLLSTLPDAVRNRHLGLVASGTANDDTLNTRFVVVCELAHECLRHLSPSLVTCIAPCHLLLSPGMTPFEGAKCDSDPSCTNPNPARHVHTHGHTHTHWHWSEDWIGKGVLQSLVNAYMEDDAVYAAVERRSNPASKGASTKVSDVYTVSDKDAPITKEVIDMGARRLRYLLKECLIKLAIPLGVLLTRQGLQGSNSAGDLKTPLEEGNQAQKDELRRLLYALLAMLSSLAASFGLTSETFSAHSARSADVKHGEGFGTGVDSPNMSFKRLFMLCTIWSLGCCRVGGCREDLDRLLKEVWYDALFDEDAYTERDGDGLPEGLEVSSREHDSSTESDEEDGASLATEAPIGLQRGTFFHDSWLRQVAPPLHVLGESCCSFYDFVLLPSESYSAPPANSTAASLARQKQRKNKRDSIATKSHIPLKWYLWPGHTLYEGAPHDRSALTSGTSKFNEASIKLLYPLELKSPRRSLAALEGNENLVTCNHHAHLLIPGKSFTNASRHALLMPTNTSVLASLLQASALRSGALYASYVREKEKETVPVEDCRIEARWRRRLPLHMQICGEAYSGKRSLYTQLLSGQENGRLGSIFHHLAVQREVNALTIPETLNEGAHDSGTTNRSGDTILHEQERSGVVAHSFAARWCARLSPIEPSCVRASTSSDTTCSDVVKPEYDHDSAIDLVAATMHFEVCQESKARHSARATECAIDRSLGAIFVEDVHIPSPGNLRTNNSGSLTTGTNAHVSEFLRYSLDTHAGQAPQEQDPVSYLLRCLVGPAMYVLSQARSQKNPNHNHNPNPEAPAGAFLDTDYSAVPMVTLHTDCSLASLTDIFTQSASAVCPAWREDALHDVVRVSISVIGTLLTASSSGPDHRGHDHEEASGLREATFRYLKKLLASMVRCINSLSVFTTNDVARVWDKCLLDCFANLGSPMSSKCDPTNTIMLPFSPSMYLSTDTCQPRAESPNGEDIKATAGLINSAVEYALGSNEVVSGFRMPSFALVVKRERLARLKQDVYLGISKIVNDYNKSGKDNSDQSKPASVEKRPDGGGPGTTLTIRSGVSSFYKTDLSVFLPLQHLDRVASKVYQREKAIHTLISAIDDHSVMHLSEAIDENSEEEDDEGDSDEKSASRVSDQGSVIDFPVAPMAHQTPPSHSLWADVARLSAELTINAATATIRLDSSSSESSQNEKRRSENLGAASSHQDGEKGGPACDPCLVEAGPVLVFPPFATLPTTFDSIQTLSITTDSDNGDNCPLTADSELSSATLNAYVAAAAATINASSLKSFHVKLLDTANSASHDDESLGRNKDLHNDPWAALRAAVLGNVVRCLMSARDKAMDAESEAGGGYVENNTSIENVSSQASLAGGSMRTLSGILPMNLGGLLPRRDSRNFLPQNVGGLGPRRGSNFGGRQNSLSLVGAGGADAGVYRRKSSTSGLSLISRKVGGGSVAHIAKFPGDNRPGHARGLPQKKLSMSEVMQSLNKNEQKGPCVWHIHVRAEGDMSDSTAAVSALSTIMQITPLLETALLHELDGLNRDASKDHATPLEKIVLEASRSHNISSSYFYAYDYFLEELESIDPRGNDDLRRSLEEYICQQRFVVTFGEFRHAKAFTAAMLSSSSALDISLAKQVRIAALSPEWRSLRGNL